MGIEYTRPNLHWRKKKDISNQSAHKEPKSRMQRHPTGHLQDAPEPSSQRHPRHMLPKYCPIPLSLSLQANICKTLLQTLVHAHLKCSTLYWPLHNNQRQACQQQDGQPPLTILDLLCLSGMLKGRQNQGLLSAAASVWKSGFLAFWPFFWARTLPLKFPITIRVWEHKISGSVWSFSSLRTGKFSFSGALVVLGNFNRNVLAAKLPKKAKDWTFKH